MSFITDLKITRNIIWIVGLTFVMEIIDGNVLNTSLPQIAKTLHHNPIELKAAVTIYFLSCGIIIPVSGWFAERFGEKHTLLLSIILFLVGSFGCALAFNLATLVVFRFIQGMGGGFMAPVGRLILIRAFGQEGVVMAMSRIAMLLIFAMAVGPLLGGAITTYTSWRYIFILNIPIGLFAMYYIAQHLPSFGELKKVPFDFKGFVYLGMFLGMLLLFLDLLVNPAIDHVIKFGLLLVSGISLVSYMLHEKKTTHPLIHRDIFADKRFNLVSAGSFLTRLSMSAVMFLVPLMLQASYGYEAVEAGCFAVPVGVGAYFGKKVIRPILKTYGYRPLLLIGSIAMALILPSYYVQAIVLMPVLLLVQQFVFGFIFSIMATTMNSFAYRFLQESHLANGTSFYSAIIQVSMSFGIALAAVTMIAVIGKSDLTHNVPLIAFKAVFLVQGFYAIAACYVFSKIKE